MNVFTASANKAVYPDVAVVCGHPEFNDQKQRSITNPLLILEVLSKPSRQKESPQNCSYTFERQVLSI
ncbi:MAG: Uma2 family endonuclease [Saprospiraceae bacterium]|nr:MAG: Uma2 family endonuclease [Saprospiraceae bacterium]